METTTQETTQKNEGENEVVHLLCAQVDMDKQNEKVSTIINNLILWR
jgi:hypothetical protein